jgi:hypothetical protein
MDQCPSTETDSYWAGQEIPRYFMEPEVSSLCLQNLGTGNNPKQVEYNPHPYSPYLTSYLFKNE